MDPAKTPWFTKAETEIGALRDVESVRVQGDGDAIREIHVLTRSSRAPKQIVRDVQAVIHARFNRSIDYRVVSVAYLNNATKSEAGDGNGVLSTAPDSPAPPEPTRPPVVRVDVPSASAHATGPRVVEAPPREPERHPAADERIRFGGVNLFVSGARTQAQVELVWRGLPRLGTASGWSTRTGAHRLVAQATLVAVQEFLADELALGLVDVEFLRLGRKRGVVVSLSMLVERQEKLLVGTCVIEQDLHQAVVFATLGALNRLVAGMRPKEPTEYVLRPTSVE
ncbi:MAG: hypothetical protein E6K80_05270 [Candidatus Eisenbacteria bacterium]|uniref:2-isopropylmalate synthase LeuA allosteric (dimerisation) domain-containing protein n=1 Tax=Eiseniibacteriota bacterium TaxID=2212470 RepID=A0A538U6Q3_UNCEI|nr:MAG: hypothetical protein E6K80_05270 [Candidatus Eisenbacteria bacterium]